MSNTKWEVSIIELKKKGATKYKVTRRLPELHVAETKMFGMSEITKIKYNCSDFRACSKIISIYINYVIFDTKEEALRQMEE